MNVFRQKYEKLSLLPSLSGILTEAVQLQNKFRAFTLDSPGIEITTRCMM